MIVDRYNSSDFTLEQTGVTTIRFSSNIGIFSVLYDASVPLVSLTIPDSYKGPEGAVDTGMTGLCGDYNGDNC